MRLLIFLALVVLVFLMLRRASRASVEGRASDGQRDNRRTPVVGGVYHPASVADLLGGEPLLAEMKDFRLEVSLVIDSAREAAIGELRECHALDDSQTCDGCPVVKFWSVPSSLLNRLFPAVAKSEVLDVCLRDAVSGLCARHCSGYWPDIEADLRQFLASPSGTREVAQERGELADGVYFLEETFMHLDRRAEDGQLRVWVTPRARMVSEVEAQLRLVRQHMNGATSSGQ